MSKLFSSEIRPFISLILIIMTLFTLVFFKMEMRRMGYTVYSISKKYKTMRDRHRLLTMDYAKITRPDRLRKIAISKLTLSEAKVGQIIQMTGNNIALTH